MNSDPHEPSPILLFKYGGNAMVNPELRHNVLRNICKLKDQGAQVVIVHGGGPFIQEALDKAGIESEFIEGHRKTTPEALQYVEMALKGRVNGELVSIINSMGYKAVGLSGKDGQTVTAVKRLHKSTQNGVEQEIDLGSVGDVQKVDPTLIRLLLDNDFIPVLTCIASDQEGIDYNINGDMFAGHIAGALKASQYIVLTDVDGLLRDKNDPSSIISEIALSQLDQLFQSRVIQGGMIPKMESCRDALEQGAETARIINGTRPDGIAKLISDKHSGTRVIA
jgi:acetylglutamate kinase